MAVNIQHVLTAFQGGLGLNMRIMREYYDVTSFELVPKPTSLLSVSPDGVAKGAPLRLICDNSISPYVLLTGYWQPEEFAFVHRVSADLAQFTLIDVGANVGLFSRQCLARLPNCTRAYCYEPDRQNFDLLEFNLRPFSKAICRCVALSDNNERATYFIDPDNCGNYSLNQAAMPAEHRSATLDCVDAAIESTQWTADGVPVFYKSDTQGLDEVIATRMNLSFWDSVFGGIFEVWQIKKPAYDLEKLRQILDKFPNKCFLTEPATLLTTDELIYFVNSEAGASKDLGFWR